MKRIRPVELGPFDYQKENYSHNVWVAEGITSYYASRIALPTKIMSPEEYLERIANIVYLYESNPGRFKQSPADASFDAWIKEFPSRLPGNSPENFLNSSVSIYSSGYTIGLLTDIEIRSRTKNAKSLDDVMRLLLKEYGFPKPGFTDAQLKAAIESVAGGDMTDFFSKYVYGTVNIDFDAVLAKVGLQINRSYSPDSIPESTFYETPEKKPGSIGLDNPPVGTARTKIDGDSVIVLSVLTGTPAFKAGVYANDQIVAINEARVSPLSLSNLLKNIKAGQTVTVTVFRRDELLNIDVVAETKPFNKYTMTLKKDVTAEQVSMRNEWLK